MASVEEIVKMKFDYVIVGGGTAGLTLAARLAANANITILLLEAGPMNLDDPKINVSGFLGQLLMNPKYDWMFETSPQKYADGKTRIWSRGKTLGGSSAINFYLWSKPAASNIDAWEELGNLGWNWNRYMQATLKTESFTPPASDRSEWRAYYQPASHGTTGPLQTTFAHMFSEGDVLFHRTLENLGVKKAKNIIGGDPIGAFMGVQATSATNFKRSYSAQAFYLPNKDAPNLKVLCNAFVQRLLTRTGSNGLVAEGVEFECDGKLLNAFCKGEVILCSGTIKTSQILELSGIGDRAILEPLGIETKIYLPGVGSNVQEHIFTSIGFEINPEHAFATTDNLRNPIISESELKLHPRGEGLYCLATSSMAFIPLNDISSEVVVNEIIAKQKKYLNENSQSLPPGLKEQYDIQLRFLGGESADCEIIFYPGYFPPTGPPDFDKCYACFIVAIQHPFSRGTIHITSSDPHLQAEIDPCYFKEEIDRHIFREAFKYARKVAETEPLKESIAREIYPGPQCQTEDEIDAYLDSSFSTFLHTIGSASMLPREHNGVVDNKLRVYGTENIRIADLSIVPIHFCSHSQATAYAIGEIAAELILDSL